MQSYYLSLFSIEITVLGIIAASIFVIFQLIGANFSHIQIDSLLSNVLLKVYAFACAFIIGITVLGSSLLLFEQHDFINFVNLHSNYRLAQPSFVMALTASFIILMFMGFVIVFRSFRLLDPKIILSIEKDKISRNIIDEYLFLKFGLPEPQRSDYLRSITVRRLMEKDGDVKHNQEYTSEYEARIKLFDSDLEIFNNRVKALSYRNDFLESFQIITNKAIATSDLETIKETSKQINVLFKEYVLELKNNKSKSDFWSPEQILPKHFIRYVSEWLNTQIDVCIKHSSINFVPYFLSVTQNTLDEMSTDESFAEASTIFVQWKNIASKSIQLGEIQLFKFIISAYVKSFEKILPYLDVDSQGLQNQFHKSEEMIFKSLSWIFEFLLKNIGDRLVDEYLIASLHNDELSIFLDALESIGRRYNEHSNYTHPMFYFETILIIFGSLNNTQKTMGNNRSKSKSSDGMYTCIEIIYSYAFASILSSNLKGLNLAILKLMSAMATVRISPDKEIGKDITRKITKLAIKTVQHNSELSPQGNTYSEIVDEFKDFFRESSMLQRPIIARVISDYRMENEDISDELENFFKSISDDREKYIKGLGDTMRRKLMGIEKEDDSCERNDDLTDDI